MKRVLAADLPTGEPLEVILGDLISDISEKQEGVKAKLGYSENEVDQQSLAFKLSSPQTQVLATLYINNEKVLSGLRQALEAQRFTLACLNTIGPDQGVYGKPRV